MVAAATGWPEREGSGGERLEVERERVVAAVGASWWRRRRGGGGGDGVVAATVWERKRESGDRGVCFFGRI